jgi:hypothetical protein
MPSYEFCLKYWGNSIPNLKRRPPTKKHWEALCDEAGMYGDDEHAKTMNEVVELTPELLGATDEDIERHLRNKFGDEYYEEIQARLALEKKI